MKAICTNVFPINLTLLHSLTLPKVKVKKSQPARDSLIGGEAVIDLIFSRVQKGPTHEQYFRSIVYVICLCPVQTAFR